METSTLTALPAKLLKFSAVVLAGGRSTRMGTDKSFLRVGQELLLERQLRCLRGTGAAELLISGRRDVDYSSLGAAVIYDQHPGCGPLAGVAAALKSSSCSIVFVLAVDMPAMIPAMLNKILFRCTDNLGCVPLDHDGFQPLAAAYPETALPLAEQCLKDGELSMQRFVKRAMEQGLVQPLKIEPPEQVYFANWNQPSDWIADVSG